MEKIKTGITYIILTIIVLPLLVFAAIYLVLLIPVDYIKYKRSLYYKNEKQKYSLFECVSENFKLYNEIAKSNLPIEYIKHPEDNFVSSGWFVYKKTLFIMSFLDFEYDEQRKIWVGWQEDDGKNDYLMSLDELIEIELQEKNELVGGTPYENAVVWISAEALSDIEQAKKEDRFLIYEKDRVVVLRQFCEER